jgi:hypothetical protein
LASRISSGIAVIAGIAAAKRHAGYAALRLAISSFVGSVILTRQHWAMLDHLREAPRPSGSCVPHPYTSQDARAGSAAISDFYYKHHAVTLPKGTKGTCSYIADVLLGFGQREAIIPQSTIPARTLDLIDLCIFCRRNTACIPGDLQKISAELQSRLQYFDILGSLLCGGRIAPAAKSSPMSI